LPAESEGRADAVERDRLAGTQIDDGVAVGIVGDRHVGEGGEAA
jgi:hypothetical protein